MTSQPIRDPLADHLITPQNSAFVLIDYQPEQLAAVRSMDHDLLIKNAVSTVRTVKTFGVPLVHSTVNVASGRFGSTLSELAELLEDDPPLDRTTVNSWRTSSSFRPFTRRGVGSSSSARCGPRCAWRSPRSTRCARYEVCPSSTRSGHIRSRRAKAQLRARAACQPARTDELGIARCDYSVVGTVWRQYHDHQMV